MIFSFSLQSSKCLLMPTRSTRKEINDRVTHARHSHKLIPNQWQPRPRKFLKECDCCQEASGPRGQCPALAALTATAEGRGQRGSKPGGHRPAREWILHTAQLSQGSQIASGINRLCFMKPSARICVSCPAVNKAGSGVFALLHVRGGPRSQTRSAASEPKFKFLLPDSGSRAYRGVMGRSNFGMTDSGSLFRDAYLRFLRSLAWHVSSTKLI